MLSTEQKSAQFSGMIMAPSWLASSVSLHLQIQIALNMTLESCSNTGAGRAGN